MKTKRRLDVSRNLLGRVAPSALAVMFAAVTSSYALTINDDVDVVETPGLNDGNVTIGGLVDPGTVTTNLDGAAPMVSLNDSNGTSTGGLTALGGVAVDSGTKGQVTVSNNGDVNIGRGSTESISATRVTEHRTYDPGHALEGQIVPGSQVYYLTDSNGNEIPGTRVEAADFGGNAAAAEAEFNDRMNGTAANPADNFDYDSYANVNRVSTPGNGGNLNVEGFTTTNGISNNGIFNNNGNRITGVADGVFWDDAVNVRQLEAAEGRINNRIAAASANLGRRIDRNTRGIAMVAAMTNTTVEPGKTHGVDFNVSQFQSETGFGIGYANRLNDCVQLRAAVASTQDFKEAVGRIGVSFQW